MAVGVRVGEGTSVAAGRLTVAAAAGRVGLAAARGGGSVAWAGVALAASALGDARGGVCVAKG